ncbi:hypothetical protein CkaCkLH20_09452 [Colletotrichum karsti]|uniref:Uncharacterized protein n=1 Tax=Colletotrichum karsti TaxID=1095194 RepID=A0A9P6LHU9_9PEZI|nr:uncharacterized protein CkaCkLH20_09452 [Colletotrichum karsti]KAF9872942.1 hypothetical protein CkaCkLH20_09452 [Colletotrichum karsti]
MTITTPTTSHNMGTDDDLRSRKREREEEGDDMRSPQAAKTGKRFLEEFLTSSHMPIIPEGVTDFAMSTEGSQLSLGKGREAWKSFCEKVEASDIGENDHIKMVFVNETKLHKSRRNVPSFSEDSEEVKADHMRTRRAMRESFGHQDESIETPGSQRQAQPQNNFNPGTQSQHGIADGHCARQPETSSVPGYIKPDPQAQPQPQSPAQLGSPDSYWTEQPNMSNVPGNTKLNQKALLFTAGFNTSPQAQYGLSNNYHAPSRGGSVTRSGRRVNPSRGRGGGLFHQETNSSSSRGGRGGYNNRGDSHFGQGN